MFKRLIGTHQQRSDPSGFHLTEAEFLAGNFRLYEGIKAGKKPRTTSASDLVKIHAKVLGRMEGRDALVKQVLETGKGRFVHPSATPSGYVPFGRIATDGDVFVMQAELAADLAEIEPEIAELGNKDFYTNQVFEDD